MWKALKHAWLVYQIDRLKQKRFNAQLKQHLFAEKADILFSDIGSKEHALELWLRK